MCRELGKPSLLFTCECVLTECRTRKTKWNRSRILLGKGYVFRIYYREYDHRLGLTYNDQYETIRRLYSAAEAESVCGKLSNDDLISYEAEPTESLIEQARRDAPFETSDRSARVQEQDAADTPPIFDINETEYHTGMDWFIKEIAVNFLADH